MLDFLVRTLGSTASSGPIGMKLVPTPELLDSDAGTPAEVAASLRDLQRVNRWFGGVSTTTAMIERVAHTNGRVHLSLLEVASGSGYVPKKAQSHLRSKGINLSVTILDRVRSHLENSVPAVVADALALPFPDDSFDLVSSNLFAHHLSREDVARFIQDALRVCRVAVLINDLIRHPLHLALVYAGFPLYRGRLTRHDAPASVRQAYTIEEMREMLRKAGARKLDIQPRYLFRMGAIAWKRLSDTGNTEELQLSGR